MTPQDLNEAQPTLSQSDPVGFVERIDAHEIKGWVYRPETPDDVLIVSIEYDGTQEVVMLADGFRSDLLRAGIGAGNHSFLWKVPARLSDLDPLKVAVRVGAWQVPVLSADPAPSEPSPTVDVASPEHTTSDDDGQRLIDSGLFEISYLARFVDKNEQATFHSDPVGFFLRRVGDPLKCHPLFDPVWYKSRYGTQIPHGQHPLVHYLRFGIQAGLQPNYGFMPEWYLSYLDQSERKLAATNPAMHYYRTGWKKGYCPHPFFSPSWYLDKHADIKRANIEPLAHYLSTAHKEGRQIHPLIDQSYYRTEHNLDGSVLQHFWDVGAAKGASPHPMLRAEMGPSSRKSPFQIPSQVTRLRSWLEFNRPTNRRSFEVRRAANMISDPPFLSIIMPIYDPPLNILRDVVNSALTQSYSNFELIMIDDASKNPHVRQEIAYLADTDPRIKVIQHEKNKHISISTNDGAAISSGEYLVFLDHDDLLARDALAILAIYISARERPDVLYSDDFRSDLTGHDVQAARFKPGWSPELLLSYSYASHLRAVKRELYNEIGGSRPGYEGSQDHDMFIRLAGANASVAHIPHILYGRRALPGSTALSGDEKPYSYAAGAEAVRSGFLARGLDVEVVRPDWAVRSHLGIYKPVMPNNGPSVQIIIPTKNNMRTLIRLLRSLSLTSYQNFDVLIVDNKSDDPAVLNYLSTCPFRVVTVESDSTGFNFSRLNNIAASITETELILFLNDDTEILTPDWLSQMVGWSQIPGVGVVGARLLFGDRRVQHGGVSPEQRDSYTMFRGLASNEHGYLSSAMVTRNCAAVTAACMLTRRMLFRELGGFDERLFGVAYNDIDYCLRVREQGLRVVFCAEAELFHHEGTSREKLDKPTEIANFRRKYEAVVDPYLNPNLDRQSCNMELAPTVVRLPIRVTPPRVLFCSHNFNHEGAPNSLFELARGLSCKGLIKASAVGPHAGPLMGPYRDAGILAEVSPAIAEISRAKTRDAYEAACEKCARVLKLEDYDLVVANTAEMHGLVHAANHAGVPSVWIIREGEPWNEYYGKLGEEVECKALAAFRLPYRVVFVSEASRRNWAEMETNNNFEVIRNGLDTSRFEVESSEFSRHEERRRFGIDQDDVVILSVGGVIPRKGQHDLLLCLPFLPPTVLCRLQVVLVGGRHNLYGQRLAAVVESYPSFLRDRITVVPETRAVRKYFVASDIFFFGSRAESYPRVILEAELAGLPIVTTPTAGVPEQVRGDYNGLFYQAGYLMELARLIEKLVVDPGKRKEMGARSRAVFESLDSFPEMLRRYQAIFESAAMSAVPGNSLQ